MVKLETTRLSEWDLWNLNLGMPQPTKEMVCFPQFPFLHGVVGCRRGRSFDRVGGEGEVTNRAWVAGGHSTGYVVVGRSFDRRQGMPVNLYCARHARSHFCDLHYNSGELFSATEMTDR